VRPALVEVALVSTKHRREVQVVDDQQVVEQLSTSTRDKSFRDCIHIRRPNCRADHLRARWLFIHERDPAANRHPAGAIWQESTPLEGEFAVNDAIPYG
jgi:hypothetical protein